MHKSTQRGFTLLELMISLTVGLLLIGGTVAMMRNSGNSLNRHETNADMVSAIRLATNTVRHGIHSAGYFGRTRFSGDIVGRLNDSNPLPDPGNDCYPLFYADIQKYIAASDDNNPFATTCLQNVGYKAGTDVLIVRYAKEGSLTATTPVGNLEANGIYIYSNPTGGEIFRGNTPPIIDPFPHDGDFEPDIGKRFYEMVTYVYFIGKVPSIGQDGLYRLAPSLGLNPFEPELISSDIQDLQVLFGMDDCDPDLLLGPDICDGAIDEYVAGNLSVTAATPTYGDVSRVLSASVAFTALSEDKIKGAAALTDVVHKLRDTSINASPRAMFQASTFQVRNSEEIFQ